METNFERSIRLWMGRPHLGRFTALVIRLWLGRAVVQAAEWQWSAPVTSVIGAETQDHPRAFLWIPPDCRQVRAVVVGQYGRSLEPKIKSAEPVERTFDMGQ